MAGVPTETCQKKRTSGRSRKSVGSRKRTGGIIGT